MRGPGRDVRQADLQRRARIHRKARTRSNLRHYKGYALGPGAVRGERNQRDPLQRDTVARPTKGLHVLHLQSPLHKLLRGDTRVPDRSANCSRTPHGRQLSRLLESALMIHFYFLVNMFLSIKYKQTLISCINIIFNFVFLL